MNAVRFARAIRSLSGVQSGALSFFFGPAAPLPSCPASTTSAD